MKETDRLRALGERRRQLVRKLLGRAQRMPGPRWARRTQTRWSGRAGTESDREQKVGEHADADSPASARASGLRLTLYSPSLGLVMALFFLGSWLAQSITGVASFNARRLRDLQTPFTWWDYVLSADIGNRTLQNWQSELLAVASMAILSVYLRQRGSPESKPVGAAHASTGVEG
ncbi:DUF6766 family protein [Kitasatospora sp. NPDC057692]|uniref:DUF6766 family protein n=1 Tax=Kitasatospora sp. NPDC057692 TaxID=3346215 RepID=UPI0036748957